jgi:hypothetical protein
VDMQLLHLTLLMEKNLLEQRHAVHLGCGLAALSAVQRLSAYSHVTSASNSATTDAGEGRSEHMGHGEVRLAVMLRCVLHVLNTVTARVRLDVGDVELLRATATFLSRLLVPGATPATIPVLCLMLNSMHNTQHTAISALCASRSPLHLHVPPPASPSLHAPPAQSLAPTAPQLQTNLRRAVVQCVDSCMETVHRAVLRSCETADKAVWHEALSVMPALRPLPAAGGAAEHTFSMCAPRSF